MSARTRAKRTKPGSAAKQNKGTIGAQSGRDKTTAITLSTAHWETLRAVAAKRAAVTGGRSSVSGVIGDLIEDNLAKLQSEAGPLLRHYQRKA